MSGFFDGILLHQVLQWHHLLSLVPDPRVQDLRVQILADGLFHVLMYVIAVLGLIGLWRARSSFTAPGALRKLVVWTVAGFGLWNVLDVVVFHWIMRIHRIRVDSPEPLAWDVGWLIAFGLIPLVVAAFVRRGRGGGGPHTTHAAIILAVAIIGAGAWALRPPSGTFTTVLFRPGIGEQQMMAALLDADARIIDMDAAGGLAVADLPMGGLGWSLYRNGALLVGRAGPSGCLAWSRLVQGKGSGAR